MTRNPTDNADRPLRRELLAVLMYVNRGAALPKRASSEAADLHLQRLVAASRMQ